MTIDLTGRTAVVTGSTAGSGRATAEGLAVPARPRSRGERLIDSRLVEA